MRAPDHAPTPDLDWLLVGSWIAGLLTAGVIANVIAAFAAAWS